MDKERYEKGLAARTEVLGAEFVERSLKGADDFNAEFQEMVTEYCWGGTWGRGLLEKRDRSILNLGMLAALGRSHEFGLHFRGAIRNGLSLDELKEVLLQITVYCGAPAGVESFRIARTVIAEMKEKGEL
jgi:4-carboxymuconolactone decarboxylase